MTELKGVRYCAHCGNNAPQKVIHEQEYPADFVEENGVDVPIFWGRNFVATCETCNRLSVYDEEFIEENFPGYNIKMAFLDSKLVWPSMPKLDPLAIPKTVLEFYAEASKIKMLAPSAFVVQIRRALEAVCLDQGVTNQGSLHASLKKLTDTGKLPPLLSEVTNIIKIIGNVGAHAVGPPIYNTHVLAIDDFFRVVLEYLYIAPHKLKKFKEEVSKFKI